jgi:PAS domain S-box-containing protein
VAPDSTVLGVNEYGLQTIGMSSNDFIGKNPYDFYPKEMADKIVRHNSEVIEKNTVLSQEETIQNVLNQVKHFIAIKSPLKDAEGNMIGFIGTSIEITAQKEAERRESEAQQYLTEQQSWFSDTVKKVDHDINSLLSVMSMVLNGCEELPEEKRTILRSALHSALSVLSSLSAYTNCETAAASPPPESGQNLLVADYVAEVLKEKKYQYLNHPVDFKLDITPPGETAHVDVQPGQLRRSLSSIINNAIDALPEDRHGLVTILVDANEKQVSISICDNGNGRN